MSRSQCVVKYSTKGAFIIDIITLIDVDRTLIDVDRQETRPRQEPSSTAIAADPAGAPIVLGEAQHRALVGQRVVDKIHLGEG